MSIRVQKYGGSSVATTEQIEAIAERVTDIVRAGQQMIVVVSAMGDTTDELARMALKLADAPNRRELDMLLSTGERITMALLSIAINARGCPAISFTGSQAGILTDESHTNARIVDLKPTRVEKELSAGSVVILAGFQGVSPVTKEITTLGRGGSDLTAVAMASHFQAEFCEIMKDVDGVYTADPRIVSQARHIPNLTYDQLLEMTFWGSQVLHHRSVEVAKERRVPIVIRRSDWASGLLTRVGDIAFLGSMSSASDVAAIAVNSHGQVCCVVGRPSVSDFSKMVLSKGLPLPEILTEPGEATGSIYVTGPTELLVSLRSALHEGEFVVSPPDFATVSVTLNLSPDSRIAQQIEDLLGAQAIPCSCLILRGNSATVVVSRLHRDRTTQLLHKHFFE